MSKVLFNIYYWIFFLFLTLFGLVLLPFILFVTGLFSSRTIASALRRLIRLYGWILVRIAPFLRPVKVEYPSRPLPAPAIFVANHASAIDPYLFGAIEVDENSFVTSWPFRIPIYGFLMRMAGYVNSNDGWQKVLKKCMALLDCGSSVTIWPEGHRSRDGRLGRFRKGAFVLAVKSGRPVVPVCILGSGGVLPPGKRLLQPGRVRLVVLPPVYPPASGEQYERVKVLRQRVRDMIEKRLTTDG